ncbi:MAG: transketolase [Planctomycetes bacterium]|nr:transketolase [Planctomycetota bacterium]
MPDEKALAAIAQKLRRHSLVATAEAGSGHPTSCMSCAEIVSVLFFHEMRWDPADPFARNVDSFVLSKGHAAPILWAALKEAGAIQIEDLLTLRRFTSTLEGHPTPLNPWVRVATGSLGQGLSCAAGIALARRMDAIPSRVYCLLGDGESAEGSVWEAAQFASFNKLDNLCAIVDVNALGQSGATMPRHSLDSYAAKFVSFGWHAVPADGHSVPELLKALENARAATGRPTAIVARTQKGRGVSFLEGKEGWHGRPPKKGDELTRALAEIGDAVVATRVAPRTVSAQPRTVPGFALDHPSLVPEYRAGQEVATREAYGSALVKLGRVCPDIVVLDGDTKNSTFSEKFLAAHPDRFVECYIAEQNMVGAALGLAKEGKIPFASTFACFLTRACDQLRMAVYSRPQHLVLCGSHVGVSIGEDGPSQMGLEDLAMFRALLGTTVLYPSDAVSAERLTCAAAKTPGIVYLRMSRPKTKVLYDLTETFPVGGSKTWGDGRDAAIVAAGVTLHEALAAQAELEKSGVRVRVLDAYSVKPIDEAAIRKARAETRGIVVVEDLSACGGLGVAVAAVAGPVEMLAIREIPRSGKPRELMERYGIASDSIAAAVRRIVGR